jgi:type VI secretion system protein
MANPRGLGEGLFERLSGHYADGATLESVPRELRRAKSICDHLFRMYNTRRDTLPHLPDYGLPDINDIYRRLPQSLTELEEIILEVTLRYEPRLERVRIRPIPTSPHEFTLKFEISAVIKGGERIFFQTSFTSQGRSTVEAMRLRN